MSKCNYCQHEYQYNDIYCANCGKRLPELELCTLKTKFGTVLFKHRRYNDKRN